MSEKLIKFSIGNAHAAIEGWPTSDIDGLLDAMKRWPLDPGFNSPNDIAPFRCRAWKSVCVSGHGRSRVYEEVCPLYPEHPEAVQYLGNFLSYSFGFMVETDCPELIERLDAAIAANLKAHQ